MSKDKLDSMKSEIYRNKKWTTTIDKKQTTMSDIDGLVNKIEKKVSTEMRLLIFTMILLKKVKYLQKKDRQRIGKNLKKKIDKEPATNKADLESEETAAERRIKKGQGLKILNYSIKSRK